jgi:hypothetical protein
MNPLVREPFVFVLPESRCGFESQPPVLNLHGIGGIRFVSLVWRDIPGI